MSAKPEVQVDLPEGFHIDVYAKPEVKEYLSIYKGVGEKYNWFDRLLMPEEKLAEILQSSFTRIFLLRYHEEVGGFAELNLENRSEVEIVYFGLFDQFTGRKAGFPFLMQIVSYAWELEDKPWEDEISRVWLHTCDLDHPAALPLYQKAGFIVYKSEVIMQPVMPDQTK